MMKALRLLAVSTVLMAGAQVVNADDYLLDASVMAVGATAGENLVVKEGCINNRESTCGADGKTKYLTGSSQIKAGSLEIFGTLTGDFEFSFLVSSSGPKEDIIQFLTEEDKGVKIDNYGGFYTNGVGKDGGANFNFSRVGWEGDIFNEVIVTVKQGVARAYTNGQEFRYAITGLEGVVFNRVVISGIETTDRIAEVKIRGIQADPSVSCSPIPAGGTTTVSGGAATINPDLSIHIPNATYTPPFGVPMNLWADLIFMPSSSGELQWKIGNYGINP